MQILGQLGIIFAFGFAGEVVTYLLPFSLPAGVTGMVLLLTALLTGLLKQERIGGVAGFLTGNMSFFFLPSSISILQYYDVLKPIIWKVAVICAVATVATFLTTYLTVRTVQTLLEKRRRS